MSKLEELRKREFDARQIVGELTRLVFEEGRSDLTAKLAQAEQDLRKARAERTTEEPKQGAAAGKIVEMKEESNLLGPDTTGLEVTVDLRMATVPTAIVHLFDAATQPLVRFFVRNASDKTKRLRFISYVEGYSATAVETLEIESLKTAEVLHLPTFFPERIAAVNELTRATVNIEVQDLDKKTEVHRTAPVWLLARTNAPLQSQDPKTGNWTDMTPYLAAFVTPNATSVMEFLKVVSGKQPNGRLAGYQIDEPEVRSQVKAVYEAVSATGTKYVNSVIDFTPEKSHAMQRVRLPRESLHNASANCIDGTVLVASLLEAISLNPAIVIVPGHAFAAWETWRNSTIWSYLETTMLSTHSFEDACARGDQQAQDWQNQDSATPGVFKRMSLRDLRAKGITPLE